MMHSLVSASFVRLCGHASVAPRTRGVQCFLGEQSETGLLREPHFPHLDNGTLSPTSLQGQVEVLEGPLSSSSSVCPPPTPVSPSAVEPSLQTSPHPSSSHDDARGHFWKRGGSWNMIIK